MLEPQSRAALLEALRPPDGFTVSRAIATTFTLDLTALLTAPLAFSMYDGLLDHGERKAGDDPVAALDPYALLKSVRDYAERTIVFCQAGRISVSGSHRPLLAYLESSVVQVTAPEEDGVFHPKVWVLRFTREEDDEVRYRVLCLSRNLTFDRCWDTMLSLDGVYTQRTNAFAENHPLGDFVAGLPGLAAAPMDPKKKAAVVSIADELRRVKFELPQHVESLRFHSMGSGGTRAWPFDEVERLLIVSPFVTQGALERLSKPGRKDVLVSRVDQLQAIPADTLGAFAGVHVLNSAAELEDEDTESEVADIDTVASGLHAKVFVADDGWNAHVWTGSANATTAAFERNVEFLVQLTGKKRVLGVDALLEGNDGKGGLAALLVKFAPPPQLVQPTDVERQLEQRLSALRTAMGRARWVAVCGAEQAERFPLTLHCRGAAPELVDGVSAKCWPISLPENRAQVLQGPLKGQVADFGLCSFEAITSFFAIAVRTTEGATTLDGTFVVNATLEGAPADRNGRILRSLLDSPAKVLRFIHLLLAHDPHDVLDALEAAERQAGNAASNGAASGPALLEVMLRALDRNPPSIDAVERVVRDLREGQSGKESLPAGFAEIWEPIWAARSAERAGGRS